MHLIGVRYRRFAKTILSKKERDGPSSAVAFGLDRPEFQSLRRAPRPPKKKKKKKKKKKGSRAATSATIPALDPPQEVGAAGRRLARQRQGEREIGKRPLELEEFVPEQHVTPGPRGEQQRSRRWLAAGLPIPDHGHERHDAGAGRRSGAPVCWKAPARESVRRSGPRSSIVSPTWATSWKKGETSPSARRSIASSITLELLGAEAIEELRMAV